MVATLSGRLRIGTRGSALARRQTSLVVELLRQRHQSIAFEIVPIQTAGDANKTTPISQLGDKAVFVRAIEQALLTGDIDLAVHSLKDLPVDNETAGLELAAFPPRGDPRDAIVSRLGLLGNLPSGAVVGTGSPRRRIQLLAERPDLRVAGIRGNVDTRLRKLDAGEYDAIVLAAAGLQRLGLEERVSEYLSVERCIPDAGQGILAVQTRTDDPAVSIVSAIDDPDSRIVAIGERAVVRSLGAGCHTPVGAYAEVRDGTIRLHAIAANDDGSRVFRDSESGPSTQAAEVGAVLGSRLLSYLY